VNVDSSPRLHSRRRGGFAHALFAALFFVCPRDMRREYGTAILGDFDERYAAASARGTPHASAFAVHALFDLVASGLLERFEAFGRDLSYAVRGAARAPVFATVVVLTMAIAIALNATVFAAISATFLRPLPIRDAGSLLVLWETNPHIGTMTEAFTYPDLEALRRETRTLASIGAIMTDPAVFDGAGSPRELNGYFASPDLFGTYGTRLVLGRSLTAADTHDGSAFVIVISNELWHSAFGADPHVVGRFVRISDYRAEIIGVAEPHVVEIDGWRGGLAHPDFWAALKPVVWRNAGHLLRVVARAKLGVSQAAVDADLTRIFTTLAAAHPADDGGFSAEALGARDALVGRAWPFFLVLVIAMLAVLVVACANVGNLFLSRASARTGEFAVRFSLGAARGRIVAQLLTEVGLYVSVGGLLGLVFTVYATRAVAMLLPGLARIDGYGIDPMVLAFTAFVIVAATLLAGLAPANALGRPDLSASLKASGRGADLTRGRKLRATLAVVEIALAVAITTAAGLNVHSLQALTQRALGYDTTNLWLVHAGAHYMKRYATLAGQLTFYRRVSHELITTPGIATASWSSITPFHSTPDVPFTIAGRSYGPGTKPDVDFGPVDAAYFATFRIHTLAGRTFDASDRESSAPTVVVNAAFARRYFGGVSAALGKRITIEITGFGQGIVPRAIVGVVADVRQTYDRNAGPIAYLPGAAVVRQRVAGRPRDVAATERARNRAFCGRPRRCATAASDGRSLRRTHVGRRRRSTGRGDVARRQRCDRLRPCARRNLRSRVVRRRSPHERIRSPALARRPPVRDRAARPRRCSAHSRDRLGCRSRARCGHRKPARTPALRRPRARRPDFRCGHRHADRRRRARDARTGRPRGARRSRRRATVRVKNYAVGWPL